MQQKLKIVVLLLALVAGSFASKSTYQPKLNPALTLKDRLSKSHLGNAILNMVQLGNKAEADFDQLFEALDLLKQSLAEKKQAELADFNGDGEVHKTETQRLQRLINSYRNSAILYQDELDNLITEASELERNLENQQAQLKNAEAQRDSEIALIEQLGTDFDQQSTDYQNALNLLAQAVEKLEEAKVAQGNALGNSIFGSFIETNKESLSNLGEQLNHSLNLLKTSSTYTKPLSQFFVQLTNGTPDSSTLDRAIEALNNLSAYFQEGLASLEANYNAQVTEHNNLLNTVQIQIGNLSSVIIPKTQQELDSNAEAQGIRENLLASANRDERIEQGNLDAENESWEQRIEIHQTLMPQYDSETQIVEQAETLLREQA